MSDNGPGAGSAFVGVGIVYTLVTIGAFVGAIAIFGIAILIIGIVVITVMLVVQTVRGNFGPIQIVGVAGVSFLFFRYAVYTLGTIQALNDGVAIGPPLAFVVVIGIGFGGYMLYLACVEGTPKIEPILAIGAILLGHGAAAIASSFAHYEAVAQYAG